MQWERFTRNLMKTTMKRAVPLVVVPQHYCAGHVMIETLKNDPNNFVVSVKSVSQEKFNLLKKSSQFREK